MRYIPSGDETREALVAVLEDQRRRRDIRNAPPPPPPDRRRLKRTAAMLLAAATVWLLVAPPELFRPNVPTPTPEAVEAGLYMDIYVAARQVLAYRARHGRLPVALADALAEPEAAEHLTYTVSVGDFFEIRGERAGQRVVYYSNQSLADFVADARAAVRAGISSRGRGPDLP